MNSPYAALVSALLAFSGSWGCATTTTDVNRMSASRAGEPAGRVTVAIHDRSSQLHGGVPSARVVRSLLSRLDGKGLAVVHESEVSSWSLADVPPGKYVFCVTSWVDERGRVHSEPAEEGFVLAAGESASIHAVLEDRRRTRITTVAAVGGGALVVAVLYELLNVFTFGHASSAIHLSSANGR